MKFKIGDRVKFKRKSFDNRDIIIDSFHSSFHDWGRIKLKVLNDFYISGSNVILWAAESHIELDKQYYRNEKLEEILS